MITQSFDLNLIPESSPVVVHCDQYDKGTGRLVISLYEGSVAYSPSGTATIQGCKPDGKGFEYDATLSGNVVTANLTEQMSAVAGRVRCQIVVTETTGRTGSFAFILDVQPSALPLDTDISESDYQFIEQALEDCAQAVEDAQGYSEDAESWAVGKRDGQDVPSTDPAYHNNSKYWSDMAAYYAQGGMHYRGSITFSQLPTTGMVDGDMYNITDDFVTDNRFVEGSGIQCHAGQNVCWRADDSKWDLPAVPQYVPEMTSSVKGIGKPDGKTTEVSSGTFNAIGVSIPAEVNSGATQYASNWLYYEGTTEVITPSTKQNYRVIESGTANLYYWTGSAYAELTSGGGGGGGMNTDGHNAASNVGFTGTKVFTVGDRTGKANAGTEAIELGSGGNATGYGAVAEGAKCFNSSFNSTNIAANTTSETLIHTLSISNYPYQSYSLTGSVFDASNIQAVVDGGLSQDITITSGNATVRLTQDGTNIKAYGTNTGNTAAPLFYGYAESQNLASGSYSHVEGIANTASGSCAHAEGKRTVSSGDNTHAEGYITVASGMHSHAEGSGTNATGWYAHSEGNSTKATGNGSHAEGFGTKATSNYQHVAGKYNIEDNSNVYAYIVGNGTADNARSNALTLDWAGNLEVAGNIENGNGVSLDGLNTVSTLAVSLTGWSTDTTSQSGTTLYKKQISLSHLYVDCPSVEVGAGTGYVLPTVAEQEAYNLLQYVTVDDTVPCLYLYASAIPTTAFYIKVKGVD